METLPELADYMFELPPELVAQHPPRQRGQSRLMVLERAQNGPPTEIPFTSLAQKLPPETLLILNEVRVSQARLLGCRPDTTGQVEAFILEPPPPEAPSGIYELWCLTRPGRRIKIGCRFVFTHPDSSLTLEAEVVEVHPDGRRRLRFFFQASPEKILDQVGHVPLPFYIKRSDSPQDKERYQTVYGRTPGAVAAPTAGLHFTSELLRELQESGCTVASVTLKISSGTFAPLTQEHLDSGRLHPEQVTVPEQTVEAIATAKARGQAVVAVGTTTVRALEWAARSGELTATEGWCDLFIRPGHQFQVVEGLITNFHLPGSSLLMLVSALAGKKRLLTTYQKAVEDRFRFYSYGDAMLII